MNFYDITYIIDEDNQKEKLAELTERYRKIYGWNEKETLQFAITSTAEEDIETKLHFLENEIVKLEKEWQKQKKKSNQKRKYISDEEHEKCKKVVSAFENELDDMEVLVMDAGRFGFIKLISYRFPHGFDNTELFTNSLTLFLDLWDEWLDLEILKISKNTPMMEMDFQNIFKCLSKNKQEEIMAKRDYFAQKAGISLH